MSADLEVITEATTLEIVGEIATTLEVVAAPATSLEIVEEATVLEITEDAAIEIVEEATALEVVAGEDTELEVIETLVTVVHTTYVHTQPAAAATWTITHNLSRYPCVSVIDSAGTQVQGGVAYISVNELVLTFSSAFSGKAFLN